MSRRRRSVPPRTDTSGGESQRSKSYRQGRAVRYRYRIAGPTFPVRTYMVDDLVGPGPSRQMARAMEDFVNDPINEIAVVEGKIQPTDAFTDLEGGS